MNRTGRKRNFTETEAFAPDDEYRDGAIRNQQGISFPLYHLRRIGPAASKPGVANVMDFDKVTSLIGRNSGQVDFLLDSSCSVASQYISRLHARVVRQGQNYHRLYDDSLNGIFINNTKITGSVILQEGDVVTFGHPYGVRLAAGVWKRQPDSEYQFIFEKCCCQAIKRVKAVNVLEDRINTSSTIFKSWKENEPKEIKHSSQKLEDVSLSTQFEEDRKTPISSVAESASTSSKGFFTNSINAEEVTKVEDPSESCLKSSSIHVTIEGPQRRITDFFPSPLKKSSPVLNENGGCDNTFVSNQSVCLESSVLASDDKCVVSNTYTEIPSAISGEARKRNGLHTPSSDTQFYFSVEGDNMQEAKITCIEKIPCENAEIPEHESNSKFQSSVSVKTHPEIVHSVSVSDVEVFTAESAGDNKANKLEINPPYQSYKCETTNGFCPTGIVSKEIENVNKQGQNCRLVEPETKFLSVEKNKEKHYFRNAEERFQSFPNAEDSPLLLTERGENIFMDRRETSAILNLMEKRVSSPVELSHSIKNQQGAADAVVTTSCSQTGLLSLSAGARETIKTEMCLVTKCPQSLPSSSNQIVTGTSLTRTTTVVDATRETSDEELRKFAPIATVRCQQLSAIQTGDEDTETANYHSYKGTSSLKSPREDQPLIPEMIEDKKDPAPKMSYTCLDDETVSLLSSNSSMSSSNMIEEKKDLAPKMSYTCPDDETVSLLSSNSSTSSSNMIEEKKVPASKMSCTCPDDETVSHLSSNSSMSSSNIIEEKKDPAPKMSYTCPDGETVSHLSSNSSMSSSSASLFSTIYSSQTSSEISKSLTGALSDVPVTKMSYTFPDIETVPHLNLKTSPAKKLTGLTTEIVKAVCTDFCDEDSSEELVSHGSILSVIDQISVLNQNDCSSKCQDFCVEHSCDTETRETTNANLNTFLSGDENFKKTEFRTDRPRKRELSKLKLQKAWNEFTASSVRLHEGENTVSNSGDSDSDNSETNSCRALENRDVFIIDNVDNSVLNSTEKETEIIPVQKTEIPEGKDSNRQIQQDEWSKLETVTNDDLESDCENLHNPEIDNMDCEDVLSERDYEIDFTFEEDFAMSANDYDEPRPFLNRYPSKEKNVSLSKVGETSVENDTIRKMFLVQERETSSRKINDQELYEEMQKLVRTHYVLEASQEATYMLSSQERVDSFQKQGRPSESDVYEEVRELLINTYNIEGSHPLPLQRECSVYENVKNSQESAFQTFNMEKDNTARQLAGNQSKHIIEDGNILTWNGKKSIQSDNNSQAYISADKRSDILSTHEITDTDGKIHANLNVMHFIRDSVDDNRPCPRRCSDGSKGRNLEHSPHNDKETTELENHEHPENCFEAKLVLVSETAKINVSHSSSNHNPSTIKSSHCFKIKDNGSTGVSNNECETVCDSNSVPAKGMEKPKSQESENTRNTDQTETGTISLLHDAMKMEANHSYSHAEVDCNIPSTSEIYCAEVMNVAKTDSEARADTAELREKEILEHVDNIGEREISQQYGDITKTQIEQNNEAAKKEIAEQKKELTDIEIIEQNKDVTERETTDQNEEITETEITVQNKDTTEMSEQSEEKAKGEMSELNKKTIETEISEENEDITETEILEQNKEIIETDISNDRGLSEQNKKTTETKISAQNENMTDTEMSDKNADVAETEISEQKEEITEKEISTDGEISLLNEKTTKMEISEQNGDMTETEILVQNKEKNDTETSEQNKEITETQTSSDREISGLYEKITETKISEQNEDVTDTEKTGHNGDKLEDKIDQENHGKKLCVEVKLTIVSEATHLSPEVSKEACGATKSQDAMKMVLDFSGYGNIINAESTSQLETLEMSMDDNTVVENDISLDTSITSTPLTTYFNYSCSDCHGTDFSQNFNEASSHPCLHRSPFTASTPKNEGFHKTRTDLVIEDFVSPVEIDLDRNENADRNTHFCQSQVHDTNTNVSNDNDVTVVKNEKDDSCCLQKDFNTLVENNVSNTIKNNGMKSETDLTLCSAPDDTEESKKKVDEVSLCQLCPEKSLSETDVSSSLAELDTASGKRQTEEDIVSTPCLEKFVNYCVEVNLPNRSGNNERISERVVSLCSAEDIINIQMKKNLQASVSHLSCREPVETDLSNTNGETNMILENDATVCSANADVSIEKTDASTNFPNPCLEDYANSSEENKLSMTSENNETMSDFLRKNDTASETIVTMSLVRTAGMPSCTGREDKMGVETERTNAKRSSDIPLTDSDDFDSHRNLTKNKHKNLQQDKLTSLNILRAKELSDLENVSVIFTSGENWSNIEEINEIDADVDLDTSSIDINNKRINIESGDLRGGNINNDEMTRTAVVDKMGNTEIENLAADVCKIGGKLVNQDSKTNIPSTPDLFSQDVLSHGNTNQQAKNSFGREEILTCESEGEKEEFLHAIGLMASLAQKNEWDNSHGLKINPHLPGPQKSQTEKDSNIISATSSLQNETYLLVDLDKETPTKFVRSYLDVGDADATYDLNLLTNDSSQLKISSTSPLQGNLCGLSPIPKEKVFSSNSIKGRKHEGEYDIPQSLLSPEMLQMVQPVTDGNGLEPSNSVQQLVSKRENTDANNENNCLADSSSREKSRELIEGETYINNSKIVTDELIVNPEKSDSGKESLENGKDHSLIKDNINDNSLIKDNINSNESTEREMKINDVPEDNSSNKSSDDNDHHTVFIAPASLCSSLNTSNEGNTEQKDLKNTTSTIDKLCEHEKGKVQDSDCEAENSCQGLRLRREENQLSNSQLSDFEEEEDLHLVWSQTDTSLEHSSSTGDDYYDVSCFSLDIREGKQKLDCSNLFTMDETAVEQTDSPFVEARKRIKDKKSESSLSPSREKKARLGSISESYRDMDNNFEENALGFSSFAIEEVENNSLKQMTVEHSLLEFVVDGNRTKDIASASDNSNLFVSNGFSTVTELEDNNTRSLSAKSSETGSVLQAGRDEDSVWTSSKLCDASSSCVTEHENIQNLADESFMPQSVPKDYTCRDHEIALPSQSPSLSFGSSLTDPEDHTFTELTAKGFDEQPMSNCLPSPCASSSNSGVFPHSPNGFSPSSSSPSSQRMGYDKTRDKQREERREKLHSAVLSELKSLNQEIRSSLSVVNPNIPNAVAALEDLDLLPINPVVLKKFPAILETVEKCCRYGHSEIRKMSQKINTRFESLMSSTALSKGE